MDQASLRQLREQVSAGAMPVDRAVQELRHLPFEDPGPKPCLNPAGIPLPPGEFGLDVIGLVGALGYQQHMR